MHVFHAPTSRIKSHLFTIMEDLTWIIIIWYNNFFVDT